MFLLPHAVPRVLEARVVGVGSHATIAHLRVVVRSGHVASRIIRRIGERTTVSLTHLLPALLFRIQLFIITHAMAIA